MATTAVVEKKPNIVLNPKLCVFCKTCEIACVEKHEKAYAYAPRLRIVRKEHTGLRLHICIRCPQKYCINSCERGALSYVNGNIVVDTEKCDGCGACVKACPFKGIALHPLTGKAIVCDLCGGDPACVKACPFGALSLKWIEERRG